MQVELEDAHVVLNQKLHGSGTEKDDHRRRLSVVVAASEGHWKNSVV